MYREFVKPGEIFAAQVRDKHREELKEDVTKAVRTTVQIADASLTTMAYAKCGEGKPSGETSSLAVVQ